MTDVISAAVRLAGCQLTCAATPADARALLAQQQFDVIIVSLALSNSAGLRFLMELKQANDVPVVALISGWGFASINYQRRMATVLGACGTLVAPVSSERARVVLEQALSIRAG